MALSLHSALLSFNAPVVGVPSRSALARSSVDMAENLSFLGTVDMDAEADKWRKENPWFAKFGFGPSVKAERWNGRHAMFGWAAIFATGYAKAHGFFPEGDVALTYKDWGGLAQIGGGGFISNERAIIMIAHIHALGVSALAALGPQPLGESLTLDGEDEKMYGFFPPLMGQGGLTPAAEMWNGRLAMLGLTTLVFTSMVTGKDILEVVDLGVGGLLFK